jgi:hypothetical protein
VQFSNGAEQTYAYDDLSGLMQQMKLKNVSVMLRDVQYSYDLVGNLVRTNSPNPKLALSYIYDGVYRLTGAKSTNG